MDSLDKIKQINKLESVIEDWLYTEFRCAGIQLQTQYPVGKFRLDMADPKIKLAIECDGRAYHTSDEQVKYDKARDKIIKKEGWTIKRFSGKSIFNNTALVVCRIIEEFYPDYKNKYYYLETMEENQILE